MDEFKGFGGNTLQIRSDTSREDRLIGKWNRLRPADLDARELPRRRHQQRHADRAGSTCRAACATAATPAARRSIATTSWFQLAQSVVSAHRALHHRQRQRQPPPRRRARRQGAHRSQTAGRLPSASSSRSAASGSRSSASWSRAARLFGQSQDNYVVMPFETGRALRGAGAASRTWPSCSPSTIWTRSTT